MIKNSVFFKYLKRYGINFFTGVPDSLLKDFCAYINDHAPNEKHVVSSNEGGAIALAAGHYLATGKTPLVYMQNSGLGNAVNPLTSLADKEVYRIPMLLVIGWRGEPGAKDEPQHVKQGKITPALLETLGIPYAVLTRNSPVNLENIFKKASNYFKRESAPYAFLIKKDAFAPYAPGKKNSAHGKLSREEAIQEIINLTGYKDIVISTTGKASRELFEYREFLKQGHKKDFLTVWSMGHSSLIALGIALSKPKRQVYCLDGDGAAIMHMGHLGVIGKHAPENFKHVIFNNGVHDSVGGQETGASHINFAPLAKSAGYKQAFLAKNRGDLIKKIALMKQSKGPVLLEIKVRPGSRKNLGRPTASPAENKKEFMRFIER